MKMSQWLRHMATYGLGQALLNAFSFILLPIYTHRISPAEFGVLELLNRSADVLQMVLACGLFMATLSFYQHESGDPERQKDVFPTAIRGVAISGTFIVLLLQYFSRGFSGFILGSPEYGWAVRLLLITVVFEILYQLGVLYLQARLQSGAFVAITIARLLFGIAITAIMVVVWNWGIFGVIVANLLHTAVFALITVVYVFRKSGFGFNRDLLVEMVKLGVPLLPGGVMMFVLNNGDRYVMEHSRGATELGLYALGYKIGKIGVMFVLTPFMKVWGAVMVDYAKQTTGLQHIARVATYFTLIYMTASLALALAADEVLRLLSPPTYWSATVVVPVILLAHLFWGLSALADTAFYVSKSTTIKPFLMGFGAAISLILYFVWIPRYGMLGGAWATLAGFAAFLVVTLIAARRKLPIPYELGRMSVTVAVACGLYVGSVALTSSPLIRMLLGVVATLALPALFYLFIAGQEERAAFGRFIAKAKTYLPGNTRPRAMHVEAER